MLIVCIRDESMKQINHSSNKVDISLLIDSGNIRDLNIDVCDEVGERPREWEDGASWMDRRATGRLGGRSDVDGLILTGVSLWLQEIYLDYHSCSSALCHHLTFKKRGMEEEDSDPTCAPPFRTAASASSSG